MAGAAGPRWADGSTVASKGGGGGGKGGGASAGSGGGGACSAMVMESRVLSNEALESASRVVLWKSSWCLTIKAHTAGRLVLAADLAGTGSDGRTAVSPACPDRAKAVSSNREAAPRS